MIIIKLQGGLGNQLFLYGLYKNLKHLGREVKIDTVSGFEEDELRVPCLESMGLKYAVATRDEVVAIRDSYMDILSRIRRKIFGRRTFDYFEPADGNFDPGVLNLTKAYLDGYFQSEKYLGDESEAQELRNELLKYQDTSLSKSDQIQDLYDQIKDGNSVSLHIRRGDYLTPGIMETYGGICTDDYYERAVNTVRSKYPDARFYIFSNDLDWCREKYRSEKNFIFVDIFLPDDMGKDGSGYKDKNQNMSISRDVSELYLMASCKHHILANSSFSWWGAWLSDNEGMTIVPSKWLNNKNMTDIYTENMCKI
ncbi:MAG: alpha-1,2-fucosyltransferase [Butyrivibrio sp.]|uniref:alpha-1,2-fucosyltransferase n=1 Tax=Butyrivibrio sp. TaxID=28121 RepID=UPI0025EC2C2A|nr:alpha-1,2-fucosyltransferase [Butyrivibrio sp.]MCR5770124.1 alpha-1,2-fucosyltransferase [Butyrivibrio sp.]